MAKAESTSFLCTFGNPLLDIVVNCDDDSLLVKYGLKPDDAIEVQEWQMPLFNEILKYRDVKYVPGGSALNSSRVFQRLVGIGTTNAVTFMGCIGRDNNGMILRKMVREDGLNVCYMYDDNNPTGVSAALVFGTLRSLCANVGAANCFKLSHLLSDTVHKSLLAADVFYVEGYFLTHSHDCAMYLGEFAQTYNKLFAVNLSAVYVCKEFGNCLVELLPYADIIFGNRDEFIQFGEIMGVEKAATLREIALEICNVTQNIKEVTNKSGCLQDELGHGRIVVITQGSGPVLTACKNKVIEVEVPTIPEEQISDTIGAGDAFVGGFLSHLKISASLPDCVQAGIKASSIIVKNPGCTFPPLEKENVADQND